MGKWESGKTVRWRGEGEEGREREGGMGESDTACCIIVINSQDKVEHPVHQFIKSLPSYLLCSNFM